MVESMFLINCPICNSRDFIRRYYTDRYSNYSLCKECKAIYKNPRIAEVDYEDVNLQSDELRQKGTFYGDYKDSPDVNKIEEYYKKRLNYLEKYAPKQNGARKKNLLDVGCSTGLLMSIGNKLSYETHGIEISKFSVEKAKNFGTVFIGSLEEFKAKEKFDVVTCVCVLEHMPYPLQAVKLMLNLVKDDGVIFIETSVNEINRIRLQKFFIEKDICIPKGHLFQFNRTNILTMLKRLPNISFDALFFGIIADRDCRHAYVRQKILERPKIKFILSVLENIPGIERLSNLEFFVDVIIKKAGKSG